MSMISEQTKELRELADGKIHYCEWKKSEILKQAADTIEALSAKLQVENMERSAEDCGGWIDGNKVVEQIENEIDGVIVKDTYSKGKNAGLRKAKIFIEEQMNHEP